MVDDKVCTLIQRIIIRRILKGHRQDTGKEGQVKVIAEAEGLIPDTVEFSCE